MECEKCKFKDKRIEQLERLLVQMSESADGLLRLASVQEKEIKKAA